MIELSNATLSTVTRRTREYYDRMASRYHVLFQNELEGKPYDREVLARFASLLGAGARVLDAGCGPCPHVADLLRRHGLRVVGMDLSLACLQLQRQSQSSHPLTVMDMTAQGFADGAFDGVVAYYSMLYTPKQDQPRLFTECGRVLKPGGLLLVTVKEGDREGCVADPLGSDTEPYFVEFKRGEIDHYLQSSGLQVISSTMREPYAGEISCKRIFVIGRKTS